LAITLWMTSLSVAGGTKATISPSRTVRPSRGARVIVSPSLIEGDMLKPLAFNFNGAPLSRTAWTTPRRSGPQSRNSSPFLLRGRDLCLRAFNNGTPFQSTACGPRVPAERI
jgi:hypothetical protein